MVLCVVGVGVIALLLDWLLGFFGKHYEGTTTISLILLGIPVVQAIFGKADLALLVHNQQSKIFWVQLATLILLPLSAAAPILFPAEDATLVTSIGFVLTFLFSYFGLWLIALVKTGIDTSAPGALIRFLAARRAG